MCAESGAGCRSGAPVRGRGRRGRRGHDATVTSPGAPPIRTTPPGTSPPPRSTPCSSTATASAASLEELGGNDPALLEHSVDDSGARLRLRHSVPVEFLPSAIRRFTGDDLVLDRTETWRPREAGGFEGSVEVQVRGLPGSISGTQSLVDDGDGSVTDVEGTVSVSVPHGRQPDRGRRRRTGRPAPRRRGRLSPGGGWPGGERVSGPRRLVVTLSCPDRVGIVARLAGAPGRDRRLDHRGRVPTPTSRGRLVREPAHGRRGRRAGRRRGAAAGHRGDRRGARDPRTGRPCGGRSATPASPQRVVLLVSRGIALPARPARAGGRRRARRRGRGGHRQSRRAGPRWPRPTG